MRFEPEIAYEVALSNLYSYVTGSGKHRSRHERTEWQDAGYAQVEPTTKGVKLKFRFEVPPACTRAMSSRAVRIICGG